MAERFSRAATAIRVENAERAFRRAVEVFQAGDEEERARTTMALRKKADRVLRFRLQHLKARLAAAQSIGTAEALDEHVREIERLRLTQQDALGGGLNAILVEFGVGDASKARPAS